MAASYQTPGVYIEEISKFPPSIAEVETAIPAFIGYTQKAKNNAGEDLTLKPTRILSLLEYTNWFGAALPEEKITVTINETQDANKAVLSQEIIGNLKAADKSVHNLYYALEAYFSNGGGPAYIVSVAPYGAFPGAITDTDLTKGLEAISLEDEPTLLVFPEAQSLASSKYKDVYDAALKQCALLKDRFVVIDVMPDPGTILETAEKFRASSTNENLKYGAAYYPNLETSLTYTYDDSKVNITTNVTIDGGTPTTTTALLNSIKTTALYSKVSSALSQIPVILPPSPLVVGVYASVDNARGVWKAPANVSLSRVIKPIVKVSDKDQEALNIDVDAGKSINVIRSFTGKGTLIWGARTLAGNDNEWRYVPVRRFFNMVEESVKKGTSQFVFEPNDANTWTKVRAMIENFLILQWRAGALAGDKPEQAFYVLVGLGKTMTSLDILEGRLIIEIGLAVVRPAEFIVLRFSHKLQES